MLCQKCSEKEANVHVTKIINGKKAELYLCEDCARQNEEISFETPFTINNFLTGILDSINSSAIKVDYIKTTSCSKCGMNYGKFKQLGRLGCSECYKIFDEKLMTLVRRIHGSDIHTGKVPKRAGNKIKLKREIMSLKNNLRKAIEEERFEVAAELRDEIKGLEQNLKSDE